MDGSQHILKEGLLAALEELESLIFFATQYFIQIFIQWYVLDKKLLNHLMEDMFKVNYGQGQLIINWSDGEKNLLIVLIHHQPRHHGKL